MNGKPLRYYGPTMCIGLKSVPETKGPRLSGFIDIKRSSLSWRGPEAESRKFLCIMSIKILFFAIYGIIERDNSVGNSLCQ